ncbi:EAL and HDOD domain-containing protein [Halomonas urumqiensis]|nr:HDOD domain-containing protein [Halomonas urumqiensis]GHE21333.1 diguanylate phosphodiesterase [Halomonas urumqiensis]
MPDKKDADAFAIALEPIHDAEDRHIADQLRYRHDGAGEDPVADTARALAAVIYELDDGQRLGGRELFIDLPDDWLGRGELLPTPAKLIVIGLSDDLDPTAAMVDDLHGIREKGYRLAASASLVKAQPRLMLPLVDVIQLHSPTVFDAAEAHRLRVMGKQLMAVEVRDQAALDAYRELGCQYVNGRYLAEPTFHATRPKGRHGNRAAQLRLVNELYRPDADPHRLYELILQMPHLHVTILRRANSSYYARGSQQQSELRQAMQRLGLHELRRLVMTLSLASELPSSKLMVRMALTRAFMCRNLARPFPTIDPEDAFTTGLFSMMGPLLDEDQQTLLEEMPLDAAIHDALATRGGHLGAILALAEQHEQQVENQQSEIPLDRLQRCYLDALDDTAALMGRL